MPGSSFFEISGASDSVPRAGAMRGASQICASMSAPGAVHAGDKMTAHVAAGDRIRHQSSDHGDDDADDDLRKQTSHGSHDAPPRQQNYETPRAINRRARCFRRLFVWCWRPCFSEPAASTCLALRSEVERRKMAAGPRLAAGSSQRSRKAQSKLCFQSRVRWFVLIIDLHGLRNETRTVRVHTRFVL